MLKIRYSCKCWQFIGKELFSGIPLGLIASFLSYSSHFYIFYTWGFTLSTRFGISPPTNSSLLWLHNFRPKVYYRLNTNSLIAEINHELNYFADLYPFFLSYNLYTMKFAILSAQLVVFNIFTRLCALILLKNISITLQTNPLSISNHFLFFVFPNPSNH